MTGGAAPGLPVNELTGPGEEGVVLRHTGDGDQRILKSERAQFLHRVRSEIDADAEGLDVGRGLENWDPAIGRRSPNGQRQCQAADAAADYDDVHERQR